MVAQRMRQVNLALLAVLLVAVVVATLSSIRSRSR